MKIQVKIIDKELYGNTEQLPAYATPESAGLDLRITNDFVLKSNEQVLLSTGLAIHINDFSVMGMVVPRSGLGHKQGLILGNTVGIIDSDYQGEFMLSMWNRSHETRYLCRGDRVAQFILVPIIRATLEIVDDFKTTERGTQGWGSSGL